MIQEILNRDFVLEQLEATLQHLESQASPTRRSLDVEPEAAGRLAADDYAFNPEPATPRTLRDRTRLLLVGDWGTGNRRARAVAAHMREHLDQGKAEGVEQTVAHLGDIYYAGRGREVRRRFLRHWPVREDESDSIASYSANANHDMYSGGHAYYDVKASGC